MRPLSSEGIKDKCFSLREKFLILLINSRIYLNRDVKAFPAFRLQGAEGVGEFFFLNSLSQTYAVQLRRKVFPFSLSFFFTFPWNTWQRAIAKWLVRTTTVTGLEFFLVLRYEVVGLARGSCFPKPLKTYLVLAVGRDPWASSRGKRCSWGGRVSGSHKGASSAKNTALTSVAASS